MASILLRNRLFFGADAPCTWADLLEQGQAWAGDPTGYADRRVVFVVPDMRHACMAVAYGMAHSLDWGVIEAARLSEAVEERFAENGVHLIEAGSGAVLGRTPLPAQVQPGRVTVLTSGTTGLLKLIAHTHASLNTFDRVTDLPANSWFLPYQIGSYAWYQMVALGMFVADQDLIPGDFSDLAESFKTALSRGLVTAISSTPTFWRHALMSLDEALLASADMRSISMGGEIVDQPILDRLAGLYPSARIKHIYASSEAGAAIVVSDGKAGFDAALLADTDSRTIAIKVEDDRLYIRSPYGNTGDQGGWIDTGDLVETRAGRVYFCGRAGNTMINVGGQKAFPPDIEGHLMAHPEVVWAQVTARRAPMVGNLPVASVVLRTPMDEADAEQMLITHCEGTLAEYAVPRLWDFPKQIPMRASLKS
ncbi:Long-chain-fatty-acid--CoA ligase [Roseovarius gaetbuli]|uniref:Long-chain-fatty-acid--CoA ligase n=1 Tax=Roseovarius gaetbuli TaxID=1356575 RepID=A0A1X7A456_9RHOB|nr:class I adenylate-forming enzyme family protein [Roseovarius gaetbuli]SLN70194.1 Long-chain-fatty-acid--CoA ligase [Roseovarius gaetbuli]